MKLIIEPGNYLVSVISYDTDHSITIDLLDTFMVKAFSEEMALNKVYNEVCNRALIDDPEADLSKIFLREPDWEYGVVILKPILLKQIPAIL